MLAVWKAPLSIHEGPPAELKDEEMQKLIDGALGACATELFYVKAGMSVDGAPQGEEDMPMFWQRFPADSDR